MKVINFLAVARPLMVGATSIAIIGGGAVAGISSIQEQLSTQSKDSAVTMDLLEVLDKINEVGLTSLEPQNVEVKPKVEKDEKKVEESQPKIQTTQTSASINKPTPAKTIEDKPATNNSNQLVGHPSMKESYGSGYRFNNLIDFEKAYIGVCPNKVPDRKWPEKLHPAATLGITYDKYLLKHNTVETMVIYTWDAVKWEAYSTTDWGTTLILPSMMGINPIGDDGVDHLQLVFEASWSSQGWSVDWRRMFETSEYKGKYGVGTNATKLMDATAKQMEVKFNQLENTYHHCLY